MLVHCNVAVTSLSTVALQPLEGPLGAEPLGFGFAVPENRERVSDQPSTCFHMLETGW